jgi:hypothetical protein
LLVPSLDIDGQPVLYQFRLDTPQLAKDGKPIEYETPAKAAMRLDMGGGERYALETPPPDSFNGRWRLVMDPLGVPIDADVVQTVACHYQAVTGQPPKAIGAV